MEVLIVGGGIGGLASAVALKRIGASVTVIERTHPDAETGAGLTLWRNALAALERLGIVDAVTAGASRVPDGGVRRPDGRWLIRAQSQAATERAGLRLLTVHRSALLEGLESALPGGTVKFGAEVLDIEDQAGAPLRVRTTDGEVRSADFVVAADGIRSGIRRVLWPDAPAPRYAGFTAWRGVTANTFPLETASETWGRGREFGLLPLPDGRTYWFATANAPEDSDLESVCGRFRGWHDPIGDVIAATDPASILRHDIFEHPRPYPRFVKGRVALLGDAAHAMTPNAGQGGCQALEDAIVLAAALRDAPLPAALDFYDRTRRIRTARIASLSASIGRLVQQHTLTRDALARLTPSGFAVAGLSYLTRWEAPTLSVPPARP